MLSEMFWAFQKKTHLAIKRSVEQSKNKECKKRYYIKKWGMKVFQVCIRYLYLR